MTPVRILDNHIIEKFNKINNEGISQQNSMKDANNPSIEIDENLSAFYGPKVNLSTNIISISESFLNYLWAFIYFSFAYQEKSNEKLIRNSKATHIVMDSLVLSESLVMMKFARSIVRDGYSEWPDSPVRPRPNLSPQNELEEFILKTNGLYSTAVTCLLMHEVAHIFYNHDFVAQERMRIENHLGMNEDIDIVENLTMELIVAETEADNYSLSFLLRESDSELIKLNNSYGVISAFVAMCYAVKTLKGLMQIYHPNLHERVFRVIQKIVDINCKDEQYFAHYASQTLMLLLDQNDISLASYDATNDTVQYLKTILDKIDMSIS